ncbi:MAG TPA: flagellar biosynthetic protein FliO [Opitutaceae bacterium]|nr:flagellar biosynthetic protein FliO [Opitutaceae bacterium]
MRVRLMLARPLFALALVSTALAADDNKIIFPGGSGAGPAPAAAAGGSLNTLTLVLGLALAAVGGWLVWRNRRGAPVGRDARALAIEETRSLGNRQYLVVASYEGKKFLLGVCAGQINLLSRLSGAVDEEGGAS